MVSRKHRLPILIALAHVAVFPAAAWADDPANAPPPPPPPPPFAQPYPVAPGQPPVYLAPLAQQTQTTYVPQSVAMSGPAEIVDRDGAMGVPMGYTPVFRKRRGLIVGGWVTFGVSYGISAMTAAIGSDADGNNNGNKVAAMWIPVAGPFLQMLESDSATANVFLVGLGGAQVAGAIMLVSGMSSRQRVFVRNDLVGHMTVAPMAGKGVSGMMVSGRF